MLLFLWVILVQTEARCSCTQPGSHPVSASQTPKRGHGTAGRKRGVPDPGWNHRQRLEVGAAAGITPNLQEKPSRDTTTDGFLCILQHICLGRDPWPGLGKRRKCRPLPEKRQRTACASEGCYSCVLPVLAPEVPFSYPVLTALHLSCKFMSRTQGKKNKVGMHKDCKI